jgi:hypothetical protein
MSNILPFEPAPLKRHRHDGWSKRRQMEFLTELARHGVVRAAAEKVGMDRSSAYRLKKRPGAEGFAAAWEAAQLCGLAAMQDVAIDRALNGVRVPVFYKGEQVGERIWYDNRLLIFVMSKMMTRRFGPHASELDLIDEQKRKNAEAEAALTALRAELEEVKAGIADMLAQNIDRDDCADLERKRDVLDEKIMEIDKLIQLRRTAALAAEFPGLAEQGPSGRQARTTVWPPRWRPPR